MSINRRAARVDANQSAIVDRLRECSVSVYIIGKPVDLLCCHPLTKALSLLEVKNPDGSDRITKEQAEFMSTWPSPVHIVRSPDEAVRAVLGAEVMA